MTKSEEQDEGLTILAILDAKYYVLLLHSDGYWSGTKGNQQYEDIANHYACWEHWTPDKGDAAVWSCEEVVKHIPGRITAFFSEAEMGNPLEGTPETP